MWQHLTPFRKRIDTRRTPGRRPRRYRPHCKSSRGTLPPVGHANAQRTTCPPGRIARHLDRYGQRRWDITRLPV